MRIGLGAPLAALCMLAGLAACNDPAIRDIDAQMEACQAPTYQGLVGRPESALAGVLFAVPVRVIRPGDMVTADFSQTRINITLDGAGRIVGVACG